MRFQLTIFLILVALNSCMNDRESKRIKTIVENLKKEYKGDFRRIPLDTADVAYISGRSFMEMKESLTSNIYCSKCNDEHSRMLPLSFYFNLEQITISFDGICTKCNDTITSGSAMHLRIDYLVRSLIKKHNVSA